MSESVKTASSPAEGLLDRFRARRPLRAGSIIVTVFGDAIAPHGGTVWTGSLLPLLAALGISETLARTALSRLAGDGLLMARRHGRRSDYSLTAEGQRKFEQATRRIYGPMPRAESGEWGVLSLQGLPPARRDEMRRKLSWLGFGDLSPSLQVHPRLDDKLMEAVSALNGGDILYLHGAAIGGGTVARRRDFAAMCWDLDGLAGAYRRFHADYAPLAADVVAVSDSLQALLLRLALIHDYRRIILKDPLLPQSFLPEDWPGYAVHEICAGLYRRLAPLAESWITANLSTATGPLPPPDGRFARRFDADFA